MIWIAALLALQDPEIEIDRDNLAVEKSGRVKPGVYTVEDKDGNGVLHVTADGVTIDFQGATLRAAHTVAQVVSLTRSNAEQVATVTAEICRFSVATNVPVFLVTSAQ